ncbi:HK97 gp10 family phage protein [Cupriavidus gilardii]|uniref:HK97 gp10 family phage protein n=1 Tax=Cupriavidus gilardii TaxID=82541 RepID=UPI0021B2FB23|nr:HK97 gp10 family phage protein [Cupriavidus gilardii]UXC38284.1 HK97 gp10 family phage protein [Cupriavidus gilardii]
MATSFNFDGDLAADLDQLEDRLVKEVVRPIARAGALVFYEEARRLVPVYKGEPVIRANGTKMKPGQLRDAIYHVYSESESTNVRAAYQVSWNAAKAPHGHLVEYGHWRVNKLVKTPTGWMATTERLAAPVRVPGVAFMRRAGDRAEAAIEAMRRRAAEKVAEVLSGDNSDSEDDV